MQTTSNSIQEVILLDETYLQFLLQDLVQAKMTIDIETYIFEDDVVGKQVASALIQAASNGVRVRLLVDGVGSLNLGKAFTHKMKHAGVQIKVYHPLPWRIWQWRSESSTRSTFFLQKIIDLLSKMNSRNHRKLTHIDSTIVYIGSANISAHLIDNEITGPKWRETMIKITGIDTTEIQYAFNRAWKDVPLKRRLKKLWQNNVSDPILRLNYTWRRRHRHYKMLIHRIQNCQKRIWVTNSYFVPDSVLLKNLIKASQRGIDVRILLPAKSDVLLSSLVSATFYRDLVQNGVAIFEYLPSVLHAKILILDDWYSVGSSNLNYRSFKHDLEVDLTVQNDETKNQLDEQFLQDLNHSRRLSLTDIAKQSYVKKILGIFALFIRYWA